MMRKLTILLGVLVLGSVTLVGVASADMQTETFTATPNLFIPDATQSELGPEVSTTMVVNLPRQVAAVEVYIALDHNYASDLRMWVESPEGTRLLLFFICEGGEPNVDPAGWYPIDFTPAESMDQWIGEPMEGTWTMTWQDLSYGETGTLTEWRLRMTYDDNVATTDRTWAGVKTLYR